VAIGTIKGPKRMADFGSIAIANSPAEFAQMLREGTDQWGAKALSHWSQAVTRHLRTESKLRTGDVGEQARSLELCGRCASSCSALASTSQTWTFAPSRTKACIAPDDALILRDQSCSLPAHSLL
jgi:hypothetical protein